MKSTPTPPNQGEKIKIEVGTMLYLFSLLFIGKGYEELSSLTRQRLLQETIDSFNSLGDLEIDKESYELIKEKLL